MAGEEAAADTKAAPPARPLALRIAREALVLGVVLALVTFVVARATLSHFEFFDMSAFLDVGWRIASGQRPYVDFWYLAGPVHIYMHGLACWLLGFSKWDSIVQVALVNAIVMGVTYALARRPFGLALAAAATLVSGLAFYGVIAYPWYDQNAWLWVVLGIAACERELPFASPKRALGVGVFCGLCAGVAFMTKSSVGVPSAIVFIPAFLAASHRTRSVPGFVVGGAIAVLAITLALASPRGFIEQNLGYLAHRTVKTGASPARILGIAATSPWTGLAATAALVAVAGGRERFREQRARWLLLAGTIAASFFVACTSSMEAAADFPLAGLVLVSIAALDRPRVLAGGLRSTSLFAGALVALGALAAWHMERSSIWARRPQVRVNDYVMQNAPLRGWRCCGLIGEPLDHACAWIDANVPRTESLFVCPDATVIYAITGHESYRPAPFFYEIGFFPPEAQLREFREHFVAAPPRWIVLHIQTEAYWGDTGRVLGWLGIADFVRTRYEPRWREGPIEILRRRGP